MRNRRKRVKTGNKVLRIFLFLVCSAALIVGLYKILLIYRAKMDSFNSVIQLAAETEVFETEYDTEIMSETESEDIESEMITETETEIITETETMSETETESPVNELEQNILILNNTRITGAAGVWQDKLRSEGYSKIEVALLSNDQISDKTIIYTANEKNAASLSKKFDGSVIGLDDVTITEEMLNDIADEIDIQDKSKLADVDIFIILGKNDAQAALKGL